jgi:hypothetical protein
MRGIGRPGKIRLVARIAGGRGSNVVVIDVALNAGQGGVKTGQRIVGIKGVIEGDRARPVSCRVAGVASSWECGGDVVGVVGSGPIRKVAAVAICRQGCVVVIGVALRTRKGCMGAGEWKDRCMIEG